MKTRKGGTLLAGKLTAVETTRPAIQNVEHKSQVNLYMIRNVPSKQLYLAAYWSRVWNVHGWTEALMSCLNMVANMACKAKGVLVQIEQAAYLP